MHVHEVPKRICRQQQCRSSRIQSLNLLSTISYSSGGVSTYRFTFLVYDIVWEIPMRTRKPPGRFRSSVWCWIGWEACVDEVQVCSRVVAQTGGWTVVAAGEVDMEGAMYRGWGLQCGIQEWADVLGGRTRCIGWAARRKRQRSTRAFLNPPTKSERSVPSKQPHSVDDWSCGICIVTWTILVDCHIS